MKILELGQRDYSKWWHGKVVDCETCRRKVQLENGDEDSPLWCQSGPHAVSILCTNCGDMMRVAHTPNDKVSDPAP